MGPSTLGELVRHHRMRLGMTQQELAGRTGLSVRSLADIEHDRVRRPRTLSVQRLAKALELTNTDTAALLTALASPAGRGGDALFVAVLGPVSLRLDGSPVDIASASLSDLLGLLALQPRQAVSREQIVDVLWGDHPPKSHVRLIHIYVGQLRTLMEPARRKRSPASVVASVPGGYQLDIDADQLDLAQFDELVTLAGQARHNGELAAAEDLLGKALDCWRGPLLAGAGHRLQQHPAAAAVVRRRIAAALSYADLALARFDYHPVVDRLRDLAGDEPLHEGLAARLIVALAGHGEQVAALQLYDDIRRRLDIQLGVTPGTELSEAHLRVLRHQVPAPAAVAGAACPGPAQLPADVAAFTGRDEHLKALDALLPSDQYDRRSAVVISAIAGTAGVGKTALAVHWAHRVRDRFRDGQLHVDLRGYAPVPPLRPIDALIRFLHALGVPPEQVPADVDEAAGMYRSLLADKCVLIVLDNARSADQVRPLLPGSAGCLVLITSRDQLTGLVARDGAQRLTLDVLNPGEADALLCRLVGADRVRADPDAAAELAQLCAYLPLALRIAAANLTNHSHETVAGYTARLRANRLTALEVDGDRHAAVRSAFDLSYDVLPPPVRRLFRLLGQLPGPDITAEAAAALAGCTAVEASRLQQQLAAAHLVDQHTLGRYTLHDLLRRYAAEQPPTDDGERPRAVRRLFGYYLDTTNAAATMLYPRTLRLPADAGAPAVTNPFSDRREASAWLEAERHNLLAAVQHAAAHGPRPVAWQLADPLRGYLNMRMLLEDLRTTATAALAAAEAEDHPAAQAACELSLATLCHQQGRQPLAIEHGLRGLALTRRAEWRHGEAAALGILGNVYGEIGRLRTSMEHFADALTLSRQIGSCIGEAIVLNNLGYVYGRSGRLRRSVEYHEEALAVFREVGAPSGEAMVLANLGESHHRLGLLDDALGHLAAARAIQREVGDRGNETYTVRIMAAIHRDAGRLTEALGHARTALELAHDTGKRRYEAHVRNVLATIHDRLDRHEQAVAIHESAAEIALALGDPYAEAEAFIGLSAAYAGLGQHDESSASARRAIAVTSAAGFRMLEGLALTALAAAHLHQADVDKAVIHATAAVDLHRETGHRLGLAHALITLGDALHRVGDAAATACRQEAHALFTELGVPGDTP